MIRKKKAKATKQTAAQPQLPPVDFKPIADDSQLQQGILIAVRSKEQFGAAATLIAMAVSARAEQLMMDCTAQGVAVRFRVDGLWEKMPPMDRPTGDGVVAIYKQLCSLDPSNRRNKQSGSLPLKFNGVDWIAGFVSQGSASGERILIKLEPKKPVLTTLESLGMRQKMQDQLKGLLNSDDSLFIFSGPPGEGMPTSYRVGLESADRFVRDFHSIEDVATQDPEMINITPHTFDKAAGETPMTVLKSLLLKQPDVLVIPDFVEESIVSLMCEEISEEHRYVITRLPAKTAVEGVLRLMATYKKSAQDIAKVTCGVLNQRLIRRLCPDCRQPFQPSPQLLQKLGIPPGRVQALYQPFIPPPPEQRVDANGKPIEIQICPKCNGRGYYGRAAIFELLVIDDKIREALQTKPSPDYVTKVARSQGFLTIQEEGVLAVATGLTSLQELQRVLSNK